VSGQLLGPVAFPPGKEPSVSTGYDVGWIPDPGLDDLEKIKFSALPGLELRPLGRPTYTDYAIPAPEVQEVWLLKILRKYA
jgi:hypothetical protein